jgi:hypothetical protein
MASRRSWVRIPSAPPTNRFILVHRFPNFRSTTVQKSYSVVNADRVSFYGTPIVFHARFRLATYSLQLQVRRPQEALPR